MTRKKYGLIILSILCLVLLGTVWASAAQSPVIARQTIGSGAHLEKGSYSLHNTLGQPVAGRDSRGGTSLCVGFWCKTIRFHSVYLPLVVRDQGG